MNEDLKTTQALADVYLKGLTEVADALDGYDPHAIHSAHDTIVKVNRVLLKTTTGAQEIMKPLVKKYGTT